MPVLYVVGEALTTAQLWIAVPTEEFPDGRPEDHPFAGYFLPFPDHDWGRQGEGLVSTISDDPPQLNWIYVDRGTYELKYGLRVVAEPHIIGPWDVTKIDRRVTLEGWEGFMAVKYGEGDWALYFDRDENALKDILGPEFERVSVELVRKELKQGKPKSEETVEEEKLKKMRERAKELEEQERKKVEEQKPNNLDSEVLSNIEDKKLNKLREMAKELEEEKWKKVEEEKPNNSDGEVLPNIEEEKLKKLREMIKELEDKKRKEVEEQKTNKLDGEVPPNIEEERPREDEVLEGRRPKKGDEEQSRADEVLKEKQKKKKPRKLEVRR